MVRVKRGFVARRKRKKILKRAKGFRITLRTQIRRAKTAVFKAKRHATIGRKQKKQAMRRLWATRINAAARGLGLKYNELIHKLKQANIMLDRKVLADLAVNDFGAFTKVVESARRPAGK
ncbi:50S ribosomal protein L20 [candidate division WOR-1 bacterium RIFCSPHIGHO2_01_FULL_53_15]|uniref:Large ribosomal subunit protein bL20 n=1 Tax=candidate division WOR-1 bacterium RIFCSPHIGHO2_01_FULL_53_15 TaxID=1802564 RepID=A0A1F4Q1Y8_UNCSA|nr:MAG: 50S ribosomal protein L20 [candidate division WOR-1 bacterium RIFCSPHIGHO2_01_FULL_53_15]OGC12894.1 MAG: 50S ribosomal protein L20 [candidate division WOR-1 bacterium RIFCSPHIGHO2_02_FULL_53_26]